MFDFGYNAFYAYPLNNPDKKKGCSSALSSVPISVLKFHTTLFLTRVKFDIGCNVFRGSRVMPDH